MFEVKQLAKNTFYYEAFTNVGIFRPEEQQAVLIDSCDHKRMVKGLDSEIEEMGLNISCIINTHSHSDHICGNKYFQDKYGCRLLSTKQEQGFIFNPDLETDFYNAGLTELKNNNALYGVQSSDTDVLDEKNLPAGLGIIELPGHSFEMIGVRTADDVVFLADAVLSVSTWESYRFPFFYNVNKSVETLEKIKDMKAALFVPSHNEPLEDIRELAEYNIARLKEKKEMILSFCNGKSFDEVFAQAAKNEQLTIKMLKYNMYAVMVRNFLKALIEDGYVYTDVENNVLKYFKK